MELAVKEKRELLRSCGHPSVSVKILLPRLICGDGEDTEFSEFFNGFYERAEEAYAERAREMNSSLSAGKSHGGGFVSSLRVSFEACFSDDKTALSVKRSVKISSADGVKEVVHTDLFDVVGKRLLK